VGHRRSQSTHRGSKGLCGRGLRRELKRSARWADRHTERPHRVPPAATRDAEDRASTSSARTEGGERVQVERPLRADGSQC